MDPKIWGRNLWTSLINIAKGYPEQPLEDTKRQYYLFFSSLANVLPCDVCKINYQSHFNDLPPNLDNRSGLLHWLHQVHNKTLEQMDRPTISFKVFMDKHANKNNSAQDLMNSPICCSILILLLLIFAVACYYFYNKGNIPSLLM